MSDVVAQAKAALEGITPGPWEHHIAPHSDEQATHAEWLAGTLIGEGESLHVLTAPSPEPRFAYVVPAVTGDGPTSAKNADFIAVAPTLVQALVAEVERLRAVVGGVTGEPDAGDGRADWRSWLGTLIESNDVPLVDVADALGGSGTAEMALSCPCGNEIRLPLLLGSGNDFTVEDFHGWYLTYPLNDLPFVRCSEHGEQP